MIVTAASFREEKAKREEADMPHEREAGMKAFPRSAPARSSRSPDVENLVIGPDDQGTRRHRDLTPCGGSSHHSRPFENAGVRPRRPERVEVKILACELRDGIGIDHRVGQCRRAPPPALPAPAGESVNAERGRDPGKRDGARIG